MRREGKGSCRPRIFVWFCLFQVREPCRERNQPRWEIENSLASTQRRWPRLKSIWTTFSLARWPCNCPVASALQHSRLFIVSSSGLFFLFLSFFLFFSFFFFFYRLSRVLECFLVIFQRMTSRCVTFLHFCTKRSSSSFSTSKQIKRLSFFIFNHKMSQPVLRPFKNPLRWNRSEPWQGSFANLVTTRLDGRVRAKRIKILVWPRFLRV